jgi:diguanylate cyclase (GGDEF)-like protein/PAS domain S-box-containing protein
MRLIQLPRLSGLRSRIALLIVLGVLPAFFLVAYLAFAERSRSIAQAEHDTVRLARLAAAKEGALIEAAHQLTIALTFFPAVIRQDAQQCNAYARTLLAGYPQYTNFGVVNREGKIWCSSAPIVSQVNLRDRSYFQAVVRTGEPALGGYQVGRLTGLPSIVYASPLLGGARSKGIAFASLRAAAFGALGREVDMPQGAHYLIIDHDGKVLRRFPEAPAWDGRDIGQSSLFHEARSKGHGALHAADLDGLARVYGFAWTGESHAHSVLVAVAVPEALAVAGADRYLWSSLVTSLLIAALAFGLSLVASRAFIIAPVRQLLKATREIASGDLTYRTGLLRDSELGDLGHAVDEMAAALEQQQRTLRDSEARFRALTELSSDWYWEQDKELRFRFLSRDASVRAREGGLHVRLWEIDGIDLGSAGFDELRNICVARKCFRDFIYRSVDSEGNDHWTALSGQPIFDSSGHFGGYYGVGREVTEEKRTQLDLEQGKVFLDALINAIPSPVLVKDEQHRYIAANLAFTKFFQHELYEVIGKTDFDFFSEEDAEFFQRSDSEALDEGKVIEYERSYTLKSVTRCMRVRKCRLIVPRHSRFVVLLLSDITERRDAEQALRQSEARFRNLTELSADWYWEQDENLRFTFVSVQASDKSGFPGASSVGLMRWEHPGVDLESADWANHKAVCQEHRPFRDFVYRRIGVDGNMRWLSISGEPFFDSDGRFLGYRGVGRDITQGKRAEQEVIRHKDLYAALSHTNRAIVRISQPHTLFEEICRVAVEYGHFCLVWIGMLDKQSGWVRTEALAGPASAGYPAIRVSIDPNVPQGQGFAAAALREGRHYVVNDYFAHPRIAPWAEQARRAGVKSMATFPLYRNGQAIGLLNLHGDEVGFFTDQLVELLCEMAKNISFALSNMERESERAASERALIESEQRFRQLAASIPQVFWMVDPLNRRTTYVSPAYESVWGREAARLLDNSYDWLDAIHQDDRGRIAEAWHTGKNGHFDDEYKIIRPDGTVRWIHDRAFPHYGEDGELTLITGIAEDITERKAAEERLRILAHYDSLTGLPNRPLFHDRLRRALVHCQRSSRAGALVFADLDHFKVVNDTLGHAAGDDLLRQVAQRLQACLRADDTVCRLGGDEFALILTDLTDAEQAGPMVEKVMRALELPFEVECRELFVTASIGVTVFPCDGSNAETLLKNADTAMYRAKEAGRSGIQFYRVEMNARSAERMNLEGHLRRALERNEFLLHYQPKVDFASGCVVGAEALLRWQHPELGLVPPNRFISILEDSRMIVPVGEWVLQQVARQMQEWAEQGLTPVSIAVNLSGRQLQQKHVERSIARIVTAAGMDPSRFELEITESVLMHNPEQAAHILRELKAIGMRLSVDDFGTGYSSLSYLRSFPLDALKIDRSFVQDLIIREDDNAIVKAIVALARSLKLETVAEGVEAHAQFALLRALGCDQYQGYYFSRPVLPDELARLLQEDVAAAV